MKISGGLVALLVAAACSAGTPATAPSEAAPIRGGRVVLGLTYDHPAHIQPAMGVWPHHLLVYEPLLEPDVKNGMLVPRLATWTVSPDGLTYTFQMRAATWSDGAPITPLDWLTSVRAAARAKQPLAVCARAENCEGAARNLKAALGQIVGFSEYASGTASKIAGIEVDGLMFTVRLRDATCESLWRVFRLPPIPSHVFEKYLSDTDLSKDLALAPENLAPPVASGPFVLKEWRPGDQGTFVRNERYHDGPPYLDEFVLKYIGSSSPTTAAAAQPVSVWTEPIQKRQIDLLIYAERDAIPVLKADPRLRVTRGETRFYDYIGWNQRSESAPWLRDRRVRQALAYAIDLDRAIGAIYGGQAQRMVAAHVPMLWSVPLGLNEYRFDRARAEQLMRDAGLTKGPDGMYQKDGRPATLAMAVYDEHFTAPSRRQFALFAAEQYRDFGIAVRISLLKQKEWGEQIGSGTHTYDAIMDVWPGLVDPDSVHTRIWHTASEPRGPQRANFVGYSNPDVDRAIEQARGPDCSIEARQKAYATMLRILNEDQPYMFGILYSEPLVRPVELKGFDDIVWPTYWFLGVNRWYWAKPQK